MIDEKTQTAHYMVGGREIWLRELTVGQTQRFLALAPKLKIEPGQTQSMLDFYGDPELIAQLLSCGTTDSAGHEIVLTGEDVLSMRNSQLAEMLNDFFGLNPVLMQFLISSLLAILSLPEAAANGDGKEPSSGSTLSADCAEGISSSGGA